MKRKDTTALAPRPTRWWQAPARIHGATLALLHRVAFRLDFPDDPWTRQTPNGIRA